MIIVITMITMINYSYSHSVQTSSNLYLACSACSHCAMPRSRAPAVQLQVDCIARILNDFWNGHPPFWLDMFNLISESYAWCHMPLLLSSHFNGCRAQWRVGAAIAFGKLWLFDLCVSNFLRPWKSSCFLPLGSWSPALQNVVDLLRAFSFTLHFAHGMSTCHQYLFGSSCPTLVYQTEFRAMKCP